MEALSKTKLLLAKLMRGENRANMTEEEALAMADTAFNRTGLAGYPATIDEVLLQPGQYHPLAPPSDSTTAGLANAASTAKFGPTDPVWAQYAAYAEKALDPTRLKSPYTHYFTGEPPTWAKSLEGLTKIGSHYFGREKRRKKTPKGK
jgi:spore germination cell wall hydrolase CwlJ-like protein